MFNIFKFIPSTPYIYPALSCFFYVSIKKKLIKYQFHNLLTIILSMQNPNKHKGFSSHCPITFKGKKYS